jgi:quinol monooxygenase YgiN
MFESHRGSKLVGIAAVVLAVGCSSSSSEPAPGPVPVYIAVVRGKLASSDLAKAKSTHDQIAKGGEANAKAAGDFAHDAMLGTRWLDSAENEFLGIDRWKDASKMKAFYADPQFQQAFGALFAAPPSVEYFVDAPTWVNWGDMAAGDAHRPHFFHLALGTLKEGDVAKNQKAHDQVASGGRQPSIDAGNVGHVVYLGLDDKRRFVAVDIWSKGEPIEPFYRSPQFRGAFAPLFETVSEPVYQSTDWHQW